MRTARGVTFSRSASLVALAVVYGLVGTGCHISDYGTITDNNQVTMKKSGKFSGVQPVIDTRGKAHIKESSQTATIWPDGAEESINFVDQKADGTATLTSYVNFSTGAEPIFHNDLYCDTDREGCAIATSPDNNDANIFDADYDFDCPGVRSFCIILSTSRYYGECGRLDKRGSKIPLAAKSRLFNAARFATRLGREGLLYALDGRNLGITLTTETGESFAVPVRGSADLFQSAQDNIATLDLRNSMISSTLTWYAEFLDQHATDVTTVTVNYNGIAADFTIAGKHPSIDRNTILERRNRAY